MEALKNINLINFFRSSQTPEEFVNSNTATDIRLVLNDLDQEIESRKKVYNETKHTTIITSIALVLFAYLYNMYINNYGTETVFNFIIIGFGMFVGFFIVAFIKEWSFVRKMMILRRSLYHFWISDDMNHLDEFEFFSKGRILTKRN